MRLELQPPVGSFMLPSRLKSLAAASIFVFTCSLAGSTARAGFDPGSQGFADLGVPGIDTSSLSTATTFQIGFMASTGTSSGGFETNPIDDWSAFGPVIINLADASATTFGNDDFGHFVGTEVADIASGAGYRTLWVGGIFTVGSRFGVGNDPVQANFVVSFAQTSDSNSTLSDSAVLSVPASSNASPMTTPEPASAAMLGLGIGGLVIAGMMRRGGRSAS